MSDGTTTTSGDGLAALGSLTVEADQANPDQAQQQQQAQVQKAELAAEEGAKDWGMLMFSIGGLVTMIAPELKPIYSEDRCFTWGKHAHQVAEKYHWKSPENMPEIALIGSTVSFLVPTVFLVRAKIKLMREGKAEGLAAKIALWWRARRAGKAAAAAAPAAPPEPGVQGPT